MAPARGFPWKPRAHPTPLCPVFGSPFPSPTWKHPLELCGLHLLILAFCVVQELTKMDHLEKNERTPSLLSLYFIFPTDPVLFYLYLTPSPWDPLIHNLGHSCSAFQWNIENIKI